MHFLAKDVYYISELPSDLQWRDVGAIAGVSLRARPAGDAVPELARLAVNPAEALRYE